MSRARGGVRSEDGQTGTLPEGLVVLEQRPDVVLAAHGCMMLRLWRATATLESLLLCESAVDRFASEHARYGTLTVVERDVGTPAAGVRQAAGRLMERFTAQTTNAVVIEGTGFKHTGMRLAITTIHLLAPSSTPPPVFASIDEATDWLAAQLPNVSASKLVRDVAALRGL